MTSYSPTHQFQNSSRPAQPRRARTNPLQKNRPTTSTHRNPAAPAAQPQQVQPQPPSTPAAAYLPPPSPSASPARPTTVSSLTTLPPSDMARSFRTMTPIEDRRPPSDAALMNEYLALHISEGHSSLENEAESEITYFHRLKSQERTFHSKLSTLQKEIDLITIELHRHLSYILYEYEYTTVYCHCCRNLTLPACRFQQIDV